MGRMETMSIFLKIEEYKKKVSKALARLDERGLADSDLAASGRDLLRRFDILSEGRIPEEGADIPDYGLQMWEEADVWLMRAAAAAPERRGGLRARRGRKERAERAQQLPQLRDELEQARERSQQIADGRAVEIASAPTRSAAAEGVEIIDGQIEVVDGFLREVADQGEITDPDFVEWFDRCRATTMAAIKLGSVEERPRPQSKLSPEERAARQAEIDAVRASYESGD